jgi:cytosine/adenosine deaminase-related metal-dependent hydrolase
VRIVRKKPVELSVFDEMREFAARNPSVEPATILKMATINSARALGFGGEFGELRAGALADLITVPHSGSAADACEQLIQHRGDVTASMIDGQWIIPPPT